MKIGIVGGGMLGLTLGWRLARQGHRVELFEAASAVGGLAGTHDYGPFVWDRFYHCILPQDARLIGLLGELGLGDELRWTATRTGYFVGGRTFSMSGSADFLRFPLMSPLQKARLGAAVLWATRVARPQRLYRLTAAEWLTRLCGRKTFEVFWRPLLRAKFGPYHDRVAAVFIWATLTRLMGARAAAGRRETLGYVPGGYARILGSLLGALDRHGARVHVDAPVRSIVPLEGGKGCRVDAGAAAGDFEHVLFTAPSAVARGCLHPALLPRVERAEHDHPTSRSYLGVLCLALVLPEPLTPYYVLNIGDERVGLTGLIEMTNLVDRGQTAGRSLVYVPRYLDSEDPAMSASDEQLMASFFAPGLRRLFPTLRLETAEYAGIHRARFVQPLPLCGREGAVARAAPRLDPPFQLLNTSMLRCATLNNDEVVGLADAFAAAAGGS